MVEAVGTLLYEYGVRILGLGFLVAFTILTLRYGPGSRDAARVSL